MLIKLYEYLQYLIVSVEEKTYQEQVAYTSIKCITCAKKVLFSEIISSRFMSKKLVKSIGL